MRARYVYVANLLAALLFLGLGVSACGGATSSVHKPPAGSASGQENTPEHRHRAPGDEPNAKDPRPLTFFSPGRQACMLHQETGGHFLCLSGADGQCYHFGAVCRPPDSCSVDKDSGEYRTCKSYTEGRCEEFGAACKPPTDCVYDVVQRRYRKCPELRIGGCTRFAGTCSP